MPEAKYDAYKMLLKGGLSSDVKVITIEEAQRKVLEEKVNWTLMPKQIPLNLPEIPAIDVTKLRLKQAAIETEASDNTSASSDAGGT